MAQNQTPLLLVSASIVGVAILLVAGVLLLRRDPVVVETPRDRPTTVRDDVARQPTATPAPQRRDTPSPSPVPLDEVTLDDDGELSPLVREITVRLVSNEEFNPADVRLELLDPLHLNVRLSDDWQAHRRRFVSDPFDQEARRALNQIAAAWPPEIDEKGLFTILMGPQPGPRLKASLPDGREGELRILRQTPSDISLSLLRDWTLTGTVVDAQSGELIPDFEFRLISLPDGFHNVRSNENGEFVLRDLDSKTTVVVEASDVEQDYRLISVNTYFTVANAESPGQIFVTRAGQQLTIQVVDEDETPMRGTRVEISQGAGFLPIGRNTDADGLVTFPTVPPGNSQVSIRQEGFDQISVTLEDLPETEDGYRRAVLKLPRIIDVVFLQSGSQTQVEGEFMVSLRQNIPPEVLAGRIPVSRNPFDGRATRVRQNPMPLGLFTTEYSLTIDVVQPSLGVTGRASFSPQDIERSFQSGSPLVVELGDPEPLLVEIVCETGDLPEDYTIFVQNAQRRERFTASEVRMNGSNLTDRELLMIPAAPIFPVHFEVRGPENFLGEARFSQPEEIYTVTTYQSKFVTLRYARNTFHPLGVPRNLRPSLILESLESTLALGLDRTSLWMPLGRQDITILYYDGESNQQTFRTTIEVEPDGPTEFELELE